MEVWMCVWMYGCMYMDACGCTHYIVRGMSLVCPVNTYIQDVPKHEGCQAHGGAWWCVVVCGSGGFVVCADVCLCVLLPYLEFNGPTLCTPLTYPVPYSRIDVRPSIVLPYAVLESQKWGRV